MDPDWTIGRLLDWLADDAHQHDEALRHPLAEIEAAITGSRWSGAPSTVALTRSLCEAVRAEPGLAAVPLARLGLGAASPVLPLRRTSDARAAAQVA